MSALTIDLMSSEESDDESNELVVRPLAWRAEEISNFFQQLDGRHLSRATDSQKRQTAKRRVGEDSLRDNSKVPRRLSWTVSSTV